MVNKVYCTGCAACAAVCPTKAIEMEDGGEGFLLPRIEKNRCVQCGSCDRVCPVGKPVFHGQDRAYTVRARNEELRYASSSGGAFSLLADLVIRQGGVVFGCTMAEDCYSAYHVGVEKVEELGKLRGSKYIQSRIGDSYAKAKRALEEGKWVLFSGTPCQIAGLRGFLGEKTYDKLLCVDVICHGTASPWVWKKYLQELEAQFGAKAVAVSFRDKRAGWVTFSLTCHFANGKVYSGLVTQDYFLRGFVADLYLRESCYCCGFKAEQYASDITLGDFWGVEQVVPELADGKGNSLAIAHTAKGDEALKMLGCECVMQEVPLDKALEKNRPYYHPVAVNLLRDRALAQMRKKPVHRILKKYCGTSIMAKIRRKTAKLMRKSMRR